MSYSARIRRAGWRRTWGRAWREVPGLLDLRAGQTAVAGERNCTILRACPTAAAVGLYSALVLDSAVGSGSGFDKDAGLFYLVQLKVHW